MLHFLNGFFNSVIKYTEYHSSSVPCTQHPRDKKIKIMSYDEVKYSVTKLFMTDAVLYKNITRCCDFLIIFTTYFFC